MKKLRAFSLVIYQKMNIRMMVVAVVVMLLFLATVFPVSMRYHVAQTGTNAMPDTLIFASQEQVFELAHAYGADGRVAYIWLRVTFDLLWPMVYLFFLLTVLSNLFNCIANSRFRLLHLLPIGGVIFDLLENVMAVVVMASFPKQAMIATHILIVATTIKWLLLGASAVLVIGLLVYCFVKREKL